MTVTDLTKGIWRRVYSGALTGKRINKCGLNSEALFWRLHMVADDFGNFEIIKTDIFPRRRITDRQFNQWIKELESNRLIETYAVDGDRLGHIVNFENLQPAGKNGRRVKRFPGNPGESGGIRGNPEKLVQSFPAHTETETEAHSESIPKPKPKAGQTSDKAKRADPSDSDSASTPRNAPDHHKPVSLACAAPCGLPRRSPDRRPTSEAETQQAQSCGQDGALHDRRKAQARFLAAVMPHLGRQSSRQLPAQDPQSHADKTSALAWWDEIIWPDDSDAGESRERLDRFFDLCRQASARDRPMAWLTSRVRSLSAPAPGSDPTPATQAQACSPCH